MSLGRVFNPTYPTYPTYLTHPTYRTYPTCWTPAKNKTAAPFQERPLKLLTSDFRLLVASRRSAGRPSHAFGHDADLLHAGAPRGVDDVDDVLVPQRAGSDDEHRLVLPLIEDVAQLRLEGVEGHIVVVDRDLLVRRVVHHDLTHFRHGLGVLLALGRQVDVDALLRERERRHEDDQQHEQHVDERRDVHVRAGMRNFGLDDLVGAEVMMGVRHYLPPAVSPPVFLRSVMRPMSSTPA